MRKYAYIHSLTPYDFTSKGLAGHWGAENYGCKRVYMGALLIVLGDFLIACVTLMASALLLRSVALSDGTSYGGEAIETSRHLSKRSGKQCRP